MSDPTNRMNQLLPDRQEARIRELEAALRDLVELADITHPIDADALTGRVRRAYEVLKGSEQETPAKPPSDWEVSPSKPMHSISVNHRGRWVDGILKCWDCPAEWSPSDRGAAK